MAEQIKTENIADFQRLPGTGTTYSPWLTILNGAIQGYTSAREKQAETKADVEKSLLGYMINKGMVDMTDKKNAEISVGGLHFKRAPKVVDEKKRLEILKLRKEVLGEGTLVEKYGPQAKEAMAELTYQISNDESIPQLERVKKIALLETQFLRYFDALQQGRDTTGMLEELENLSGKSKEEVESVGAKILEAAGGVMGGASRAGADAVNNIFASPRAAVKPIATMASGAGYGGMFDNPNNQQMHATSSPTLSPGQLQNQKINEIFMKQVGGILPAVQNIGSGTRAQVAMAQQQPRQQGPLSREDLIRIYGEAGANRLAPQQ